LVLDNVLLQGPQLALDVLGEQSADKLAQVASRNPRGVNAQVLLEGIGELLGRLVAILEGAAHGRVDDGLQSRRHHGVALPHRLVTGFAHEHEQLHLVGSQKWRHLSEELVQHRSCGEDVATQIQLSPHGLLGAHVLDLALDDP
jgi:hypothetical protein